MQQGIAKTTDSKDRAMIACSKEKKINTQSKNRKITTYSKDQQKLLIAKNSTITIYNMQQEIAKTKEGTNTQQTEQNTLKNF